MILYRGLPWRWCAYINSVIMKNHSRTGYYLSRHEQSHSSRNNWMNWQYVLTGQSPVKEQKCIDYREHHCTPTTGCNVHILPILYVMSHTASSKPLQGFSPLLNWEVWWKCRTYIGHTWSVYKQDRWTQLSTTQPSQHCDWNMPVCFWWSG